MGYWQHALKRKDEASADKTIATFHSNFDFFFQVCGGLTNPKDPQEHRALFRLKSLKGGEQSNFFGNLSFQCSHCPEIFSGSVLLLH